MQHYAERISAHLTEIAALLEFSGESRFKVDAYRHAAEVVSALGDELGPIVEQGRLQKFQGLGPVLSRQIEEMWSSGTSELLNRLRGEQPAGAAELMEVEGLTPRRIVALQDALGIRSVQELGAACAAGRVRTVRGFGEKTEARLAAGVERWLTREKTEPEPMLLSDALSLANLVRERLLRVMERAELAGALRRGEETVRELEFVVVGDAARALRELSALPQVLRVDFVTGMAVLSHGVRLKLHTTELAKLGNALVLATGNAAHVECLLARGAALSGHDFDSERALYEAVGCAPVPPELRAGKDELVEAERAGFRDLIEVDDIQGMVHCHTTYSDGKNTVEEMALAAHALGMKYITITDHSPSAHYARGVTLDRLKMQWDEIAAVQEKVPVRILRGAESDILADGRLDYPDAVLEQFDILIASIHARYRMDRAAMTNRLLRAVSLPVFKVWGHPLGRILNHREAIDCDVPAILDSLAGSRGAIEVNADPHRLDLPPPWIAEARARGIPFLVSVDAHSTRGLSVLRYGVTMARRGGIRKREVLNACDAETFAARVRPVPEVA
ncbi:MAG TPA: PHP domain-containing protein [Polyangiaceae bacterium]|nr:PHP domain-containing protein [Polyangiaceae bacterium]